ncbi:hypothetical protein LZD49_15330 [Dyadobacter sp. CY261]|uniref:hypothetical protein n=1 Tax=Dyadobacter sp. CY261 TaxID=2907203 RepID=UPI001F21BCBF|nr:hypothetical protein [Dyadobacter sp. CY261]MCF0071848.1 hypothetical protein [Dyadobacter sp. CY261]
MNQTVRTIFYPSLIVLFASCAALVSCEKDTTDPVDVYAYYPLRVGYYQVFEVNEEVYSTGQTAPVVKKWQERDEVEKVISDSAGVITYLISRSARNSTADYWQKTKEYTVQKYPDKLLTSIDNQTIFSLVFPVDTRTKWNGNMYNDLDKEEYYYEDVNQPIKIGDRSFNQSLTVIERNDTSIINKYKGVKIYGNGVGLLSDEQTDFEFCQNEECIGSGQVESGTHKTRKIIDFGDRQ